MLYLSQQIYNRQDNRLSSQIILRKQTIFIGETMQTTQQYEHAAFLTMQNQKSILQNRGSSSSGSSGSPSSEASSVSSSSSAKKHTIKERRQQRQMPHYWPADKVPYLGISYCECIQYVFALLFVSVLIWVFVGLKHFDGDVKPLNLPKTAGDPHKNAEYIQALQLKPQQQQPVAQKSFQFLMAQKNNYQERSRRQTNRGQLARQSSELVLNRAFQGQVDQRRGQSPFNQGNIQLEFTHQQP